MERRHERRALPAGRDVALRKSATTVMYACSATRAGLLICSVQPSFGRCRTVCPCTPAATTSCAATFAARAHAAQRMRRRDRPAAFAARAARDDFVFAGGLQRAGARRAAASETRCGSPRAARRSPLPARNRRAPRRCRRGSSPTSRPHRSRGARPAASVASERRERGAGERVAQARAARRRGSIRAANAGRRAAGSGSPSRHRGQRHRIALHVGDAEFVVQMRAGRPAGLPDVRRSRRPARTRAPGLRRAAKRDRCA